MKPLQIGVLGLGNISDVYLRTLAEYPAYVQLAACASWTLSSAKEKAQEYNIPRVYNSADALLQDDTIDIILNLTPPHLHAEYNCMALLAGKHVYTEKPLAATFAEGKALLALAQERKRRIGCAPDTFMGARLQTIRTVMEEGLLGEIVGADAAFYSHGSEWHHPSPGFLYQPGAGPLFDMGPYYVTALVSLLGPIAQVCALNTAGFKTRVIGVGARAGETVPVHPDVPTHVNAVLQFASGATASLLTSFDVWGSKRPQMELHGTKGSISIHDAKNSDGANVFGGDIYFHQAAPNTNDWIECAHRHRFDEMSHKRNSRGIGLLDMVHAINENCAHRASGELALHVLEALECILQSAKEGRFMQLQTTVKRPAPMPESSAQVLF